MIVVKTVQLAGSCLVVVLIAVFVGWFWGAWGTSSRERELRQIELRLALTEARSRILEAQIDLNNLNYGRARLRLGTAKRPLEWVRTQFQRRSLKDLGDHLTVALAYVAEAQVMVVQGDLGADDRVLRAIRAIDAVLDVVVGRRTPKWNRQRSRQISPEVSRSLSKSFSVESGIL